MRVMTSLERTPARCAGVFLSTRTTVRLPSRMAMTKPSPPNSPRVCSFISLKYFGSSTTECGSSVERTPGGGGVLDLAQVLVGDQVLLHEPHHLAQQQPGVPDGVDVLDLEVAGGVADRDGELVALGVPLDHHLGHGPLHRVERRHHHGLGIDAGRVDVGLVDVAEDEAEDGEPVEPVVLVRAGPPCRGPRRWWRRPARRRRAARRRSAGRGGRARAGRPAGRRAWGGARAAAGSARTKRTATPKASAAATAKVATSRNGRFILFGFPGECGGGRNGVRHRG